MANTSTVDSPLYRQASEQHLALRISLGIIAVLSICSNGVLVLVFLRNRSLLKTPHNVLIFSLAITDMTTGIGLLLTPAYIIGTYNFPIPGGIAGELFCRIVGSYYLVFTLGIVSVYTVSCLAVERWFAVARPAKYKTNFKSRRIHIMVAMVWFVSFSFNAPQLFEMKLGPENQCVWLTSVTQGDVRKAVAILEFLGKFFVPLLVTFSSFLSLGIRVRQSPALYRTNQGKAGVRLLRMCTLTAVILGLCWFPNQIYYLLFKFDITKMDTAPHHVTVVMCMGNSCVNPFIYCAANRSYRRQFLNFLCPWKVNDVMLVPAPDVSPAHKASVSQVIPLHAQSQLVIEDTTVAWRDNEGQK